MERISHMDTLKYKRVLLKLSGEALANGADGLYNYSFLESVVSEIRRCLDIGAEIAVVVGGGNIWRGRQGGGMDRVRADKMGMLATVMNSIALQDAFLSSGTDARILTAVDIQGVGERFERDKALRYFRKGKLVIFGAGTGSPYFTTDTTALLRACEISADAALFAKNIDGVYTKDPKIHSDAVRLDKITYDEIISGRLGVIDLTAATFGRENKMKIVLFGLSDPANIYRAITGESIGTLLTV